MEQMEQMEHTLTQRVMNKKRWNKMEQNGTNCPFLSINGMDGTINIVCGTLNKLLFSLFRLFQLFHGEYTPHGKKY